LAFKEKRTSSFDHFLARFHTSVRSLKPETLEYLKNLDSKIDSKIIDERFSWTAIAANSKAFKEASAEVQIYALGLILEYNLPLVRQGKLLKNNKILIEMSLHFFEHRKTLSQELKTNSVRFKNSHGASKLQFLEQKIHEGNIDLDYHLNFLGALDILSVDTKLSQQWTEALHGDNAALEKIFDHIRNPKIPSTISSEMQGKFYFIDQRAKEKAAKVAANIKVFTF